MHSYIANGEDMEGLVVHESKCERYASEACKHVQGLVEAVVMRDDYEAALIAIAVWLRFSAARHLTWNRNYNVKPREIGAAQVFTFLCTHCCAVML